ncbi:MAG: hypothetical protein IT352_03015 [Gemmatimonadales bacterium]|nr:hypothetical protein [Gemmatimonadales bacterium]
MTFVTLSIPTWPTDAARSTELARQALRIAPRIRLEPARGLLWADARGLNGTAIAAALLVVVESASGAPPRAGVAATPIAAVVAARHGSGPDRDQAGSERLAPTATDPAVTTSPDRSPVTVVPPGTDRQFLARFDPEVLDPPAALYPLFAAVGIERLADLAALDQQSVEVRFGADGVRLWRLARADDPRPIFGPSRRELPNAELEWVDYELADQEQVVFIVNSLLATVTDQLATRREGAHAMVLEFALADRTVVEVPVRCAHPTADRKTWLRVIRAALEPVTFAAAVMRIGLRVGQAAPLADRQGDLFDAGFATARVTEAALAHLLDKQPDALVTARRSAHPLPEARVTWVAEPSGQLPDLPAPGQGTVALEPRLSMQLFPSAQPIDVRTVARRGETIPERYFDGTRSYALSASLGPDRVAGGFGGQRFERDYFQGVRHDGVMVLLYRDRAADAWFLAGWWD